MGKSDKVVNGVDDFRLILYTLSVYIRLIIDFNMGLIKLSKFIFFTYGRKKGLKFENKL